MIAKKLIYSFHFARFQLALQLPPIWLQHLKRGEREYLLDKG